MAVSIIIPSFDRKVVLEETLSYLFPQLEPEDLVVVVTCREKDRPSCKQPNLILLDGRKGSACQRNHGWSFLQTLGTRFSAILFLDDDVVLNADLLSNLKLYHFGFPAAVGFTCHVIADGARSGEITHRSATIMAHDWSQTDRELHFVESTTPYVGFSMRGDLLGRCQFDERLAEYGFMEDWDFFARLRRLGPAGFAENCSLVHLAVGGGRTSQRKFGFSQITNPLYLTWKGTLPLFDCTRHVAVALCSNLLKIIRPARRERLAGNLLAFWSYIWKGARPELVARIS